MNSGLTTLGIQTISIDPSNSSTLYVGTNGGGVFKSTNGGASWSVVNSGLTDLLVLALAVDHNNSAVLYAGTNSAGLFKSTNGGATWNAANAGITLSSPSIRRIVIDKNNSNALYAATFGGVFKSDNAGATWIAANAGITILENSGVPGAFGIAIDPSNSSTIYLTTQSAGGVFKTTNGGASWSALNSGLTAVEVSAIVIDRFNPATLYAATTSNAIYKSINGGSTWFEANLGFSTLLTLSLAIDPNTTTTLYAGTRNRGGGEGIFKTTNGGSNWSRVGFGVSSPVQSIAINPTNTSTVYAATFGTGIFKSTDGGSSWVLIKSGLTDNNVQSLVIDPSNSSTIYAGTDNGLFKSIDSGNTWNPFNSGLTNTDVLALAVDPITTSIIYAGTNSGLFKSTNGAASWAASSSGITVPQIIHTIVIDPTNTSTLYLGKASQGLVFKSTDGGQTWNNVSSGLPTFSTFLSALAIDPSTPTTVYAGTDSSGMFKSTIGGGTWQPTGSPAPVCTFAFSPSGQFFGQLGGLASFTVTTDPACSWSVSPSAAWITILPGGSKGPGKVNYAVAANNGGPRAGSISVGGQTFIITQAASICSYSIGPAFAAPGDTGGRVSVSVSAPGGCPWTAVSNVPWSIVTSGASGLGGGVVVLSVASNTGGPRSGTATIAGQTFSLTQGGGACGALDVTSQVTVGRGGYTPVGSPFPIGVEQNVILFNPPAPFGGGTVIHGPVYLVLLGEPTHSPLGDDPSLATGSPLTLTTCFSTQGDYLVTVSPGDLAPGQTVSADFLWVSGIFASEPSYTYKVLSGTPSK
jgi:photosystem II stability/assembly factor-like uncharacterized protein